MCLVHKKKRRKGMKRLLIRVRIKMRRVVFVFVFVVAVVCIQEEEICGGSLLCVVEEGVSAHI